ncbi:MAG: PSP1 domain-containing protein [Gemmataceae bacterium]|nr:PSP1 domain-containing protein [Gemmataceae bacterium]MCI0743353.1 PSP1 domain-containing protein [Gemmataceae bacterium]
MSAIPERLLHGDHPASPSRRGGRGDGCGLPSPIGRGAGGEGTPEFYVVSHGKSGALGNFAVAQDLVLARGQRVVIQSKRGLETGAVLCPAGVRQSRLLGAQSSGTIVRLIAPEDEIELARLQALGRIIFDSAQGLARERALPMEILDVDMLLDGQALLQFVGSESDALSDFAADLEQSFALPIKLENLALPAHHEEHGGCGKPDCGRTEGGGGCSTCSSGGGCSSCGSGNVDLRPYFAHLRTKMEEQRRVPLV